MRHWTPTTKSLLSLPTQAENLFFRFNAPRVFLYQHTNVTSKNKRPGKGKLKWSHQFFFIMISISTQILWESVIYKCIAPGSPPKFPWPPSKRTSQDLLTSPKDSRPWPLDHTSQHLLPRTLTGNMSFGNSHKSTNKAYLAKHLGILLLFLRGTQAYNKRTMWWPIRHR